jgi:hypothetical protein
MSNCYCSNLHSPFLTDFPAQARELAERATIDYDQRRRAANEARARKAQDITEDASRRFHDLVGSDRWTSLRQLMQRHRLELRDLWQPPGGPNLDYSETNRARIDKVDSVLREIGVSPQQVKTIGQEWQARLEEVMPSYEAATVPGYHLENNLAKWLELSPLHKAALPWGELAPLDDTGPNRWFLFRPPFWGFNFDFDSNHTSRFKVDREHVLSPAAGLVGNNVTMDVVDSGDYSAADAIVDTQIGFGFEAPTAGVVEVLVDAVSGIATHDLDTSNEWGWSEFWIHQRNYLTMHVLHPDIPEPSLALMSHFEWNDISDAHREYLVSDEHYFAQFLSPAPVPAGHMVILVGTRTFDITRANDVEVHGRSNFLWYIRSVEVRIRPEF